MSTDNSFAGPSKPDAEDELTRERLVKQIADIIAQQHTSQSDAAEIMGIDESTVSALVNGRTAGLTIDILRRCVLLLVDAHLAAKSSGSTIQCSQLSETALPSETALTVDLDKPWEGRLEKSEESSKQDKQVSTALKNESKAEPSKYDSAQEALEMRKRATFALDEKVEAVESKAEPSKYDSVQEALEMQKRATLGKSIALNEKVEAVESKVEQECGLSM